MNIIMQTDIEVNLQRTAMLTFSQSLWQTPQVNGLIEKLFYTEDDSYKKIKDAVWNKQTVKLLEIVKMQPVPECIKRELINIVEHMAEEIYDWHDFVSRLNLSVFQKYKQKLEMTKNLYWTSNCTIDVKKTIEKNWLNNVHSENIFAIYNMSCRYGIEPEKVDRIWKSMKPKRQDIYKNQLFNEAAYANAYYMNLRDRDIQLFAKTLRFIMEERLLEPFVKEGYVELLKSLWPKLNKSTKDSQIVGLCRLALNNWHNCAMKFEKKQYAKVVIFLFEQMSSVQRIEIYSDIDQLMRLLLDYPWHELLFALVDEYVTYVCGEKIVNVISEFLFFIVDRIGVSGKLCLVNVFNTIWNDIPNEMKDEINLTKIVCGLVKVRDFDSFEVLLDNLLGNDRK